MKLFTILLLLIPFLSFSQSNDSLKLIELEQKFMNDSIRIENIIKENKAKDSLLNQMQIQIRDNMLSKDYYSWNIGTLSVVISLIAGLILFVVGYIIPKINETKYQKKLTDIDTKYQELNQSINKHQLTNSANFSRSMYFGVNKDKYLTKFLWESDIYLLIVQCMIHQQKLTI